MGATNGIDPNDSTLYHEDPDLAALLLGRGFRPMAACDVEVGDTVAYVATLFGFPMPSQHKGALAGIRMAHVDAVVMSDDGEVSICHSAGVTPADDGDEVWTKRNEPELCTMCDGTVVPPRHEASCPVAAGRSSEHGEGR